MGMRFVCASVVALFALLAVLANGQAEQKPYEIHLAFAGPGGMTVSFYTNNTQTPVVAYGLSPQALNTNVTGTVHTYGTGYFNDVVITGLKPNTVYFYHVWGDAAGNIYQFTTARSAGDHSQFNVLVVGDMGLANSANTQKQLAAEVNSTDFYLHIGDVSYADDWYLRPGDTYEGSWDKWQQWMQPITTLKAYMTLPGNHEVTCTEATPFICPQQERNFTAYRARFRMPWRESGGVQNLWYSFDFGSVHFIQINTESDFPGAPEGPGTYLNAGPFGDQLGWLKKDLAAAAANRANVPWIIVSGHRPLYSSKASGNCAACIKAFEALFNQYNVDIYFAGHVHDYERLWPIAPGGKVPAKNYENPTVPVYIVNGAGGNVEGHEHGKPNDWTAYLNTADFGYGRLTVFNSTTLGWQFMRATDNSIADSVFINKKH